MTDAYTTLHPQPEFQFYQVAQTGYDGYTLPMKIDSHIHPLQSGAVVLLTDDEAEAWLAAGAVLPLHSQARARG